MNERILELAAQAKKYVDDKWAKEGSPPYPQAHLLFIQQRDQRLAELVVQECLALTLGKDRRQLLDKGDLNGANLVQKDIIRVIKHFGVEE